MKKNLYYLSVLAFSTVVATSFLSGCASNSGNAKQDRNSAKSSDSEEKKIRKGMTKAQVREEFGENPRNITTGTQGESWTYYLNEGEAWIPYNFGHRAKILTVHFNSEGRVKDYSYSR